MLFFEILRVILKIWVFNFKRDVGSAVVFTYVPLLVEMSIYSTDFLTIYSTPLL